MPLRKDCILFDIAQVPGGYDENAVQKLGFKLIRCPDIPENTAPKSVSHIIGALAVSYLN